MDETYEVLLPPQTVIGGRYTIVKHLASGGMAQVYVAIQSPLGRKVALKVLHRDQAYDEQIVKRFHREAVAVSKLTHPNTITVHDFGTTDDGKFYLVMELLDGEPLNVRIRRDGALAIPDAVDIAVQVAKSLSEAHQHGIVHRDLKPDNIFLGRVEHNLVKVLDFGIAHVHHGDAVTKLTQAGTIPGTPEYMSPEQAQGAPVDGRSDLYSLGVVLYEMLTGELPFTGSTPLAIILKHISEAPPRLSNDFPKPLVDFVRRLLAKDPQRRPASASEFVADLQHAVSGSTVPRPGGSGRAAPPPGRPGPSDDARRRGPMSPSDLHAARTRIMTDVDRQSRPPVRSAGTAPPDHEHAPTILDNVLPDVAGMTASAVERAAPSAAVEPQLPFQRRGPSLPGGQESPSAGRRVTLPGGQRGVTDEPDAPKPAATSAARRGGEMPAPPSRSPMAIFLEFADPTVQVLGPRPAAAALQQNLSFAQMAWNAVVEGPQTVAAARAYLGQSGSARMIEVFDMLVQRKVAGYRNELWRVNKIAVGVDAAGRPAVEVEVRR